MTIIDSWEEIVPRPDWCVGLDSSAGRADLTPEDVRSRYLSRLKSNIPIVWRTSGPARVGIISEHGEVAWDVDPEDGVEIGVLRPGKGSGFLTLHLKNGGSTRVSLAFASKYAPEYDSWLRSVGLAVARALSTPLLEQDDGFDT
jgi:hypothetical protein